MEHATSLSARSAGSSGALVQFTHGSLLLAGLLAGVLVIGGALPLTKFASFATLTAEPASVEVAADKVHPAVALTSVPATVPAIEDPDALNGEMARVRDWVSRQYRVSSLALEPVLLAAQEAGRHAGIDPLLIVAVMAVESRFNPFAESQSGAQGLMQVIPRFHMDKIGKGNGEDALFDPELNVRVGTLVLREGLRRYGSLQGALQYYGGALSDPEAGYARKVMAVKKRLISAAGRKVGSDV